MSLWYEFSKGIYKENPIFRLVLGMCPTLAVTTSVQNAIGMGIATTFVLFSSNLLISIIKNAVPKRIRIPMYIVVIASFVTIADLVMAAYEPALHKSLGIFVPLIVVNCIILGRAEAFAGKNRVLPSILDGLGMGIGFTLALLALGLVREILGNGTIYGYPVLGSGYNPMLIMILPPGAFLILGLYLGFFNWLDRKRKVS
ncbi:electron transport complex subunit RsxE [candidate division KSB1 bacterium]|nr:electron transport complex subunit E [bacterium]OQX59411.1 MAG: electron transport complex subunit RsxE [candidate division KSB1 bacterium 4484_219]RKY78552.1 MAG: electron transport complex subunit RsxE [candidate division KSB1 bacterium]HDI52159.1 electron transport complex subunit E [Bacteroidota bacterium]